MSTSRWAKGDGVPVAVVTTSVRLGLGVGGITVVGVGVGTAAGVVEVAVPVRCVPVRTEMISRAMAGVGVSVCVAGGADVGLSIGSLVGTGVSVRTAMGVGARVSGLGVGPEQAINAVTMIRTGARTSFSIVFSFTG